LNQPGPILSTPYFLVHHGYANPDDIIKKREFYQKRDPNPNPTMAAHYDSMWDENPELIDLDLFVPGGMG
jgi:hypothetical protein